MERYVLNAGEALLSARLGERIEIDQLRTLEESLLDVESDLDDIVRHPVGETKSDARIARTTRDGTRKGRDVSVFLVSNFRLLREMDLKSRYILEVVVSQLDAGVGRFRFPREVLLA
jgi:hypothetical protein